MNKVSVLPKGNKKARAERTGKAVVQRPSTMQELDTVEIPIDKVKWPFLVRRVNPEHLATLAGAALLPPIRVRERDDGTYEGVDGKHRHDLARTQGAKAVKVIVMRYTAGEAGQRSFEFDRLRFNLEHGLPLTNDERNREIRRLWSRWGRSEQRPDGKTMEELAKEFRLTKQRISQIINDRKGEVENESHPEPHPSPQRRGFDDIALLTAATKRLFKLLNGDVIRKLLADDAHNSTVVAQLTTIRTSIESVLKGDAASEAA